MYRFLKSPRLAVSLILVLAGICVAATLGLHGVLRSPVFVVPACLLIVNLGVCAATRIVGRVRRGAKPRFGPDLVHVGLLVLAAAGLATALGRQEAVLQLGQGDTAPLAPPYTISLLALHAETYEDGSPKEWTSTVAVRENGRETVAAFPLEVNRPLRLRGLSIYLEGWGVDGRLLLADAEGRTVAPAPSPGDWFEEGDTTWVFAGFARQADAWRVVFRQYRGKEALQSVTLAPGDRTGPFMIQDITAREVTRLKAVRDPGGIPFLAAIVLVTGGLALTLAQKRGDGSP